MDVKSVMHPHTKIPRHVPELKHLDVTSGGYIAGTAYTGLCTSLSSVAQGGAGNGRIGDNLQIRGIDFRASQYYQGSSTYQRWILFCWNVDGFVTPPTPSLVLQSVSSSLSVVSAYNSDSVEQGKLNILLDRTLVSSSAGPGAAELNYSQQVDLPVSYESGQVLGTGQLYLLVVTDATLAANAPNYQYWSRIHYVDL